MPAWKLTGRLLALALTVAVTAGCPGDDDGDGDTDAGTYSGFDGGTYSINGKVTYDFVPAVYSPTTGMGTLAFAQASERPVRGGVVQVVQGSKTLAESTTDESGNYQLTFTAGATGDVLVLALARSTTPPIQVEDNTEDDSVWAIGAKLSSDKTTWNLRATHGWTGTAYSSTRTAAPFAILDSMYTASKAFMAVRPVNFPLLKVNWSPDNVPQSGNKKFGFITTSHYSPSENEIYVLGKEKADTDEFDSHVIVHEWGHYFEANLSRADSPGGNHGAGDVLDPRIAFGEGYGNAIASVLLPESVYADTSWGGPGNSLAAFGFDTETEPVSTDDPNPGPFSEMSVMRAFYDLYDSGSNESSYDQVSVNLGTLYDVLVGPQKTTEALTTIGSFIAGLKAQPGVNAAAVDTLLAHYKIGPVTSPWGDGDTALRAMYADVASLPFNRSLTLVGGNEYNTWAQNQYFVFSGTGRNVNISATSTYDVGITVYRQGTVVAEADKTLTGAETLSLSTQSDAKYVLVVTGYKETPGSYSTTINIQSP